MVSAEQSLRGIYARYFFAIFEATLSQDDAGHHTARQDLENSITHLGAMGEQPAHPA